MARIAATTALILILTAAPAAAMEGGSFSPLGLRLGAPATSLAEAPNGNLRGEIALKDRPSFAGAIGLQLGRGIWLEGERLSRRVSIEGTGGFAGADMTMVNLSLQPETGTNFRPFVTMGAGLAYQDGVMRDSAGFARRKGEAGGAFAWQFGGGLQYNVSDHLAFTGSYRYLNGGNLGLDRGLDDNYDDHELWIRAGHDLPVRRNLEPLKGSRHYNE